MTDRPDSASIEEEAAAAFFQPLQGEWTRGDQDVLETRLKMDPAYAAAYRRVQKAWEALDTHAESPQLLARRQEAIAYARQVSGRRWLENSRYVRTRWRAAAAMGGITIALAAAWQLSPFGYHPGSYRTGIGEQRIIELDDHSRVELDAASALRVRYSGDARIVELKQGQAQFSVARDPTRPFKVQVGDRTIVALGTVFTVDYTSRELHIAMIEGRVAVAAHSALPSPAVLRQSGLKASASAQETAPEDLIELAAGEELRVRQGGRPTVTPRADLEAATAWREGRVIFRAASLAEAVQRLNRYSRTQIEIADDALATQRISGVFEAGDAQGFVRDIQRYLPVVADSVHSGRIRLRTR